MAQTVALKVRMSCQGCAGAVRRVLEKTEGVESFDIDLKEQKVTVKGNLQPDAVLQTVSKSGKQTAFWEAEAPAQPEVKPTEVVKPAEDGKPAEDVKPAEELKPTEELKPAEEVKPAEAVAAA